MDRSKELAFFALPVRHAKLKCRVDTIKLASIVTSTESLRLSPAPIDIAMGSPRGMPALAIALALLVPAALFQGSSDLVGDRLFGPGNRECSRACESANCDKVWEIRYGKYCGMGYTGCPGEPPCDSLDACCKQHDDCVGPHYEALLSERCTRQLRDCVEGVLDSGNQVTFPNNNCSVSDVAKTILNIADILLLSKAARPAQPGLPIWLSLLVWASLSSL